MALVTSMGDVLMSEEAYCPNPLRDTYRSVHDAPDELDMIALKTMIEEGGKDDLIVSYYADGLRCYRHDGESAVLVLTASKPWPWETTIECEKEWVCLSRDDLKILIAALERLL